MKWPLVVCIVSALIVHGCAPQDPDKYVFYLHGGIVQEQGENAVSDFFGPYLYMAILDSLRGHGYAVISERRPKGTKEEQYGAKLAKQIDSLLNMGVRARNIIVVGASQGAGIALETANILKNQELNYALLGICNEYNVKYYSKYVNNLCGRFLSIYEESDQKHSCNDLLESAPCVTEYSEVVLKLGNGHGFLYKPYPEWIHPLVDWIEKV